MTNNNFNLYLLLPDEYKEIRRCVLCTDEYTEIYNIGLLQCSIHPGVILKSKDYLDFYSCCGELVSGRYYKGCTRCDHTDLDFTSDLIIKRLNEIKSFSKIILPNILFNNSNSNILLQKPLHKSIIYKSDKNNNNDNILTYNLIKLKKIKDNHDKYMLKEKLSSFVINEEEFDDDDNINFFIKFNINEIKNDIYQESLNSPLFSSFNSFDEVNFKNKLIKNSNDNWPSDPHNNNDLNKNLLYDKVIHIPFIIIKRVDL